MNTDCEGILEGGNSQQPKDAVVKSVVSQVLARRWVAGGQEWQRNNTEEAKEPGWFGCKKRGGSREMKQATKGVGAVSEKVQWDSRSGSC